MLRESPFVVAVVLCAVLASACATKITRIDRALKTYDRALKLSIHVNPNTPIAGQAFEIHLSLQHTDPSGAAITACLGTSHEYRVLAVPVNRKSLKPLDVEVSVVDHPGCERRFTLEPSERLEWVQPSRLNIGPGPAELSGWVAVVHPKDCDQYGCYQTRINAPALRVDFK
jgi:hypothetical protein